LKWASENGLSLETCGRECVLETPRSAKRSATDFDVIDVPRHGQRIGGDPGDRSSRERAPGLRGLSAPPTKRPARDPERDFNA
jgi:hypothetical protein